ncbi:MAG TPA: rhomboid family intramembrane serine protease [Candidatus Acidoferrales bacterium]|nr:rhomboid family intramembrane serine protease [Candidatus Acidoferrales bacterium]
MAPQSPALTNQASPVGAARILAKPPIATYVLVGLNVLVYLAMCVTGVSWTDPSIVDAIHWGADFGPLTLGGQWWRLLSSMFVHFGIIHIGFNMWCLWDLGRALEFLMGRRAFVLAYLISGLAASMVSIAWDPWRVSAGASGAIFGIAGAFVSYLYFKKTLINPAVTKQKLKVLGIFIAYNLIYGLRSGVDNSAHVGGLVAGLILGSVLPPMILIARAPEASLSPAVATTVLPEDSRRSRIAVNVAIVSILVLALGAAKLYGVNRPAVHYGKAVSLFSSGHQSDAIVEMNQAVKLDPKMLLGLALLGEWDLDHGDPQAAVPVLESALQLAPNAYDLQHNLALAYLGAGDFENSSGEIARALDNEKENAWRADFILGVALRGTGNLTLAAQSLQEAIQAKPKFCEARDWFAFVKWKQDQPDAARNQYRQTLQFCPGDKIAKLGLDTLEANGQKPGPPFAQIAEIPIPYGKLIFKSTAWPYYP